MARDEQGLQLISQGLYRIFPVNTNDVNIPVSLSRGSVVEYLFCFKMTHNIVDLIAAPKIFYLRIKEWQML